MTSIVFVYNADSGNINGLKDLLHKVVSPDTYPCSLCGITYGVVGMRREWRQFVDGLDRQVEFLHRDELSERYGISGVKLPAAFLKQSDGRLEHWIDAESIDRLGSVRELKQLIEDRSVDLG